MSPVYRLPFFPKEVNLSDGTSVTLRPMVAEDEHALLEFFRRVPEEDRYYLKDNVVSPEVIRSWARNLDYDRVLPLLAVKGDRVVADGSLHFWQGTRRHMAETRVVVDPAYRNRGLARAMIREFIRIAREKGLARLVIELVPAREEAAVAATRRLGFEPLAVLPGYGIDRSGLLELDLIILALEVEEADNY